MERNAKQILREKRQEKNTQRYKSQLKDEEQYRNGRFEEENEKRLKARRQTIDANEELDKLGFKRFNVDFRATEQKIKKLKEQELEQARMSHAKLKQHMESKDNARKNLIALMDQEALKAKENLEKKQKDM